MSEVHHKGISNVQLPLSLNSSLTSHCSLGHNLRVLQAGITSIFLGLIMSQQNLSRKFLQIDIIEEHYSTWVKSRKQTKKKQKTCFYSFCVMSNKKQSNTESKKLYGQDGEALQLSTIPWLANSEHRIRKRGNRKSRPSGWPTDDQEDREGRQTRKVGTDFCGASKS